MSATSTQISPDKATKAATTAARRDFLTGSSRAVIVDSPPGAGKSTFVVATAAAAVQQVGQVPIVAQTNAQADDLCRSLLARYPRLAVGRLIGSSDGSELSSGGQLLKRQKLGDLSDQDVVVATAAKWSYTAKDAVGRYELGIIDEAYQMRSDQLLFVSPIFERALFVGDPGQLDPFTPIDDTRWRGQADGPISPAVATVLHNHPDSPVHRLPVSWRLPERCVPLVSDAFYPSMPFRSGTTDIQRKLVVKGRANSPIDKAIHTAASDGWAVLELPHRVVPATDVLATETVAQVVIRLLTTRIAVFDDSRNPETAPIDPARIAVGAAHRNQRAAITTAIRRLADAAGIDVGDVTVDTANRLQGREYDVVVVLHPLSGRAQASEFHLETGRLCVLLSRHRQACIVVARAGIDELLDAHPASAPIWLGAPIPVPDGWEANQLVIERLAEHRILIQ